MTEFLLSFTGLLLTIVGFENLSVISPNFNFTLKKEGK